MGKDNEKQFDETDSDELIEVILFKSNTCAFCPRAEEVIRDTISGFGDGVISLKVINVSDDPEKAEEYGVFALPTTMVAGVSVTGIPEPELLVKMIIGSKIKKRDDEDE